MTACILQFGTSRFLQAHVDLFAHEAALAGQAVPPIVIVQVTGDAARAGRLAAFGDPGGYPVVIRGRGPDGVIDTTVQVRSVARGLSVRRDWQGVLDHALTATHIVSNTGDTGYQVADADRHAAILAGAVPASFPAILLAVLHHRWSAGVGGVTLLPCELVQRNGEVLRDVIMSLAGTVAAPAAFVRWLGESCVWANTLVDRIVSAPIEPVGAVAEPYALWAIERQPGLVAPFTHPDVVLTDDLAPFERLKLHILNLGHSWLVEYHRRAGGEGDPTVLDLVSDPPVAERLRRLYADEVVPGFARHGLESEAADYVERTLDRFANPFLAHRIADIAAHHEVKVRKRIGGFVAWVDERDPALPLAELRGIAHAYDNQLEGAE